MSIVLGLKCKLYRGTAGTTASTLMGNVKDVTFNMEAGEADITTRKAEGWRVSVATLKEATIETQMLYDTEDSDFAAVQNAFLNNTPLALFVSDGAGNGLDCDVVVTSCGLDQNLEEGVMANVTFKPTNIGGASGRAPQWIDNGPSNS